MTVYRGKPRIAPPAAGKPPLLANVFHALRSANTALMPLFPYTRHGDIVPGATIFRGGEGRDVGVFGHTNSVDEVAICFAADKSRMRPGFVHVGARTHLVGGYFENPDDPENLMVIVVTQRQAEAGEAQTESYTFVCESCQTPLLKHDFGTDGTEAAVVAGPGYYPPLETLIEGGKCTAPYNASDAARTCPKCGTVNKPFPVSIWGWADYLGNTIAVERARLMLDEIGTAATN